MKRRYLINLAYDGTNFFGWERQLTVRTVQGELEKAIFSFVDEKVHVMGAGRTDRYVHALDAFAVFETNNDFDLKKMNHFLMTKIPDIKIKSLKEVPLTFQPRFNSKLKIYMYKIKLRSRDLSKDENYQWNYPYKIDDENIRLIKNLSRKFIGNIDFASFTAKEKYTSTIREVTEVKVKRRNNNLTFYVYGKGFMRFQVRNMVGSLMAVASSTITEEEFSDLLENPKIGKCHYKAPGQGLYLYKTKY